MRSPKLLESRFPYQFAGRNIGISIAKGWYATFAQLCADIDRLLGEEKRGFHWTQVKEKFGSARFYWSLGNTDGPLHVDFLGPDCVASFVSDPSGRQRDAQKSELMVQIASLVHAAMAKTCEMCAVCGGAGEMDSTGGYYLVLCPEHAAQRKNDSQTMDSPWFSSDSEE